jgi:hypothetical protein
LISALALIRCVVLEDNPSTVIVPEVAPAPRFPVVAELVVGSAKFVTT